MSTDPVGTRCSRCDRTYPPAVDEPHRCRCGGPLELSGSWQSVPAVDVRPASVWSYREHLPAGPAVDLGAGGTPLIDLPEANTAVKLEGCNPTGSFKDRGAAVTISRARALNVDHVREDSSGNAGVAIAAHAARAGLEASIYVPASAAEAIRTIRATGATVLPIEGDRAAVERACLEAEEGWYASHAWRPEFYAGTATAAWELLADRDGHPPASVITPVGHGTLLLGLYRGFRRLVDHGTIEGVPRVYAAQLEGAGSLQRGSATPSSDPIAPGVMIPAPAREGQVRAAIEDSGGSVVTVPATAVTEAQRLCWRAGIDTCSTAALGIAARQRLDRTDREPADADVVVFLTGRTRSPIEL